MMFQKPDKNKLHHQCPHCGSPNGEWAIGGDVEDVMYCMDCDSTWFEYEDEWDSAFQRGRIIKEVK